MTPSHLASFQVQTPDPLQSLFFGQEIVIHYNTSLPSDLVLYVRFCDRTLQRFVKPLCQKKGFAQFRVMGRNGFLSYKVELICEGKVVACKKHHLWAEIIEWGKI